MNSMNDKMMFYRTTIDKRIVELEEDVTDYHNALFDLHKKYDKLEKENEQLKKVIDLMEYQLKVQDRIIKEYEDGESNEL